MKNKLVIIISLVLIHFTIKAQEIQGKRLYSGEMQNISYLIYPSETQIKAGVTSQKELDYQYPESLMLSIMACTDADWEAFHTLGNADINSVEHYAYIKSMNKDKNYFELKHKFEFSVMGITTAVVKFYLITEQYPQPQAGVVSMQKINGRWQKCSMQMFSKIAMTALRLKTEAIDSILNQKQRDRFLKEMHAKVFDGDTLNFDKLASEIDSWYIDESKQNQEKKNYFKDPNSLF